MQHKCPYCDKTYLYNKKRLEKHCKKAHNVKYVAVCVCPHCNYTHSDYHVVGSHVPFCNKNPRVKKNINIRKKTLRGPRVQTEETRSKLSKIRSILLETGGRGGFRDIKWYRVRNILDEEFVLRGSWEQKTALWLNKNGVVWKRKIYIPYTIGKRTRTYTPDFFLPEYNTYLEVKGYFSEVDKRKMTAVAKTIPVKMLFKKHIDLLSKEITIDELLARIPSVL